MSNELRGGNSKAWDALLYCIKNGVTISAEVIEWLVKENDYVVDEGFDDFENSDRWTISKYYILILDGDAYRVWEQVGLTEMQPNEWFDQTPELVLQKQKTVVDWMAVEEIENYLTYMKNFKGV
jgi:hypothetical protein